MRNIKLRPLLRMSFTIGLFIISPIVMASAFQLWEQDGASVGNYHAGYAAIANDASTAFYNPAGITRIHDQQLVLAGSAVMPTITYKGTVLVDNYSPDDPQYVVGQGGVFAFIPAIHYVAPISDTVGFGFSIDVPFASKVDYGSSTILRYVSTDTEVVVVDISPSLGIKVTDKASIGFGPDVQLMQGKFAQVGTFGGEDFDSDGVNKVDGTGYGYHAGALYEFTSDTRAGISYHSQVVHHLTGTSSFTGPVADVLGGPIRSDRSIVDMTLPPYTAISLFHRINQNYAVMGSAIYTQWNTIQNIVLENIAGIQEVDGDLQASSDINVVIPQHFQNTWNFSLGTEYYPREDIILRAGVGYDQTPVQQAYRIVQMPDNDRYIIAFGGHYQATKALGLDVSYMHVFINKAHVIPPTQVTGAEDATTNGSVTGGADVVSGQITWNFL